MGEFIPEYGTVEWLVQTIERTTDEEYFDSPHHDADKEYGQDMLDDWMPGLGKKVADLAHDYDYKPVPRRASRYTVPTSD